MRSPLPVPRPTTAPRPARPETPPTARLAPWSQFEETALAGHVRRRLFTPGRAMAAVCRVVAPSFPPLGANDLDEVTVVLDGRVELRIGDRVVVLAAGESVSVPARTPHATRTLQAGPSEVLNVLFPPGT